MNLRSRAYPSVGSTTPPGWIQTEYGPANDFRGNSDGYFEVDGDKTLPDIVGDEYWGLVLFRADDATTEGSVFDCNTSRRHALVTNLVGGGRLYFGSYSTAISGV